MQELEQIYKLIVEGRASTEDRSRFISLIAIPENEVIARRLLGEYVGLAENNESIELIDAGRLQMIGESIMLADRVAIIPDVTSRPVHRIHFLKTAWFRYAAAILLLIAGISTYYIFNTPVPGTGLTVVEPPVATQDVMPGSDKAILTLSNGQQVQLNDSASETIKDGTLSIENNNGQLIYFGRRSPGEGGKKGDLVAMNTMTTPNGGQYQLTLADGTKVWLNAASSITYPTAFTGNTREVSITGEAYFEVAKNKEKPFVVKTAIEEITVLGTSFNVNAYPDEPSLKTSLLEGSVRIGNRILKPGEAFVDGEIVKTNVDQDVAWKNGVFNFNDQKLSQVLRQISRWYDVDIVYRENVPDVEFIGEMSKSLNLSDVIEFLKGSRIQAKLEGRKLILTN